METILIVDDEKNYLVVLEALLAPDGYETITTDNAKDALRLIRESDLGFVDSAGSGPTQPRPRSKEWSGRYEDEGSDFEEHRSIR